MEKQEIYAKLAELVDNSDNDTQVHFSKLLTTKLIRNSISLEDAKKELSKIINLQKSPMINNIKGKRVYKTLVKYYKGASLTRDEILKLVSSLITHGVIEHQSNPKMDLKSLVSLSDYLEKSLSSNDYFSTSELDDALNKAGVGKEVILIEQ